MEKLSVHVGWQREEASRDLRGCRKGLGQVWGSLLLCQKCIVYGFDNVCYLLLTDAEGRV